MSRTTPSPTLYINNLNDKVKKEELRTQLFALFMTYGRVIDVVAQKGQKMRGQAFLVFSTLAEATTAMRACEGMMFYGKPLHITYARSKSYATLRKEDPNFIPPTALPADSKLRESAVAQLSDKRPREEDGTDGQRTKKERADDEDDEEMELDDEDESGSRGKAQQSLPPVVQQPSARLLCTNLPPEVTDDVLSVLFQQYQGFQTTQVAPTPTPNAAGQRVKMAQVLFDTPQLASLAKEALDGFTLKKGWKMTVAYI